MSPYISKNRIMSHKTRAVSRSHYLCLSGKTLLINNTKVLLSYLIPKANRKLPTYPRMGGRTCFMNPNVFFNTLSKEKWIPE